MRVIQCNLNNSHGAYDFLMHHVKKWSINICIISEPPRLRDGPSLSLCKKGLAAVWLNARAGFEPIKVRKIGDGFIMIKIRSMYIVSCYLPPNESLQRLTRRLDKITECLRLISSGVIVGGDFNAASPMWDTREC